jgi:hypothetical protein
MSRVEVKSRIRLPKGVAGAVLAMAIVSANALGSAALANAEPNNGGTFDVAKFNKCMADLLDVDGDDLDYRVTGRICCRASGGVWNESRSECEAPPADTQGSRQLPGEVQIPSDIATAPVTKNPPRPIQVPAGIATVSTVS